MPYRYGGATSSVNIGEATQSRLMSFLTNAVETLGLVGLNSCDFILHHDEIYMLEINPRLSASIDLYKPVEGNLFAAHASACKGEYVTHFEMDGGAKAHQIIYAEDDLMVDFNQQWPEWVCDIPQPNQLIYAGMPICTVIAEAEKPERAKQLVKERAVFI
jgi:predicted ATP-grasp superfamily ATP-dependent carboligase